jgi:hypothetical protein
MPFLAQSLESFYVSIFTESSTSSHVIYKEISKIGVIVSQNPCLQQAGV